VARRTAHGGELLAAVSNKNLVGKGGALELFLAGLASAKLSHALVVALDGETASWLKERGAAYYEKRLTSRTGSTDNHATSGLKFKVRNWPVQDIPSLQSFLALVNHPFIAPSIYIAHAIAAIPLHDECAICEPPPDPLVYAVHHTILAMAISCKVQGTNRLCVHPLFWLE